MCLLLSELKGSGEIECDPARAADSKDYFYDRLRESNFSHIKGLIQHAAEINKLREVLPDLHKMVRCPCSRERPQNTFSGTF